MNINETLKTKTAEQIFSAVVVLTLLLILPQLGGTAMLIGSLIGLIAYVLLFRDRLRDRGWRKIVATVAIAGALGAAFAIAFRGHWR